MKEVEFVEASGNSFQRSWKKIHQTYEKQVRNTNPQTFRSEEERSEYIEKMLKEDTAKREKTEHFYYKNVKNIFNYVESILVLIKELQCKPTLSP